MHRLEVRVFNTPNRGIPVPAVRGYRARMLRAKLIGLYHSLPHRVRRSVFSRALESFPEFAYRRVKGLGFAPGGIIDCGAFNGDWSEIARSVYPETPILMIDALPTKEEPLAAAGRKLGNAIHTIAVLSGSPATDVPFFVNENASSFYALNSELAIQETRRSTETLDDVIARDGKNLNAPFFLKLDVQGAELDILRGGADTLARSGVVQLEVSLLPLYHDTPLATEAIAFMDERGFALLDISSLIYTQFGNAIQMDMLFVPKQSRLRPTNIRF